MKKRKNGTDSGLKDEFVTVPVNGMQSPDGRDSPASRDEDEGAEDSDPDLGKLNW